MKVYKFIFLVGFLNLTIPFLGVPFVYKNYVLMALAIVTVGYALILRAIEKEKENFQTKESTHASTQTETYSEQKTIEEVVDMVEKPTPVIVSDVVVRRRGRKSKAMASEQIYE